MKTLSVVLFSLIALNGFAQKETDQDKKSFDAYQEVVEALQPYIESAKTGDGKLSRSAFYGHAHVVGSVDGEVYNVTADQFEGIVDEGGPSKNVKHHIVWVDVSGPAAAAKVEFQDWGGFRFTDFFVLYKEDGKWKISGKVYDSHSRN
ncbi:nuclear transport factor 2 family protein [uncultured Croceitalea sp.]|uniref:nuclear transport factor 2 family protein n=1 Tax=uncultured Croceitalea sp. TaxID=1798908 RepID=UPI0033061498